jgi:hypothetical protein
MPFRIIRSHVLSFSIVAAIAAIATAEVTEDRFRQLLEELQPGKDEPWRTIPWKVELLDAQQQAARERKPIFIWAMDGHPLGCT